MHYLPQENDRVVVGFDQGEPSFPIILGSLWQPDAEAKGTLVLKADTIKLEAKTIEIAASDSVSITAETGNTTIKGTQIHLN